MLYIAKSILKDQGKAEDAVVQAFIKIIDKFQKFSFKNCNKTRGLLGILVKDICYDMLRAEKREKLVFIEESSLPVDIKDIPFDDLVSKENYQKLLKAISDLPVKSNSVLKLKYGYNYTNQEIADFLNISEENVRVRLCRAKKSLLNSLSERNQDDE